MDKVIHPPDIIQHTFEGQSLSLVEIGGCSHVIAREVGKVLGYADDGGRFVSMFRDWSADLREGEHVVRVDGAEMGGLRATTDSVGAKTRSLILLTERGLLRALMLAGGPKAVRFRDWAEEVLFLAVKESSCPVATLPPGKALDALQGLHRQARLVGDTALASSCRTRLAALLGVVVPSAPPPAPEDATLAAFLARWHDRFGEMPVRPGLLTDLRAPVYPAKATAQAAASSIGHLLSRLSDGAARAPYPYAVERTKAGYRLRRSA